jgi:hypothetical protein
MAARQLPSQEILCKLFRYDPGTGDLFHRPRTPDMFHSVKRNQSYACQTWNTRFADTKLDCLDKRGYIRAHIKIDGAKFETFSHRVAWKIVHGVDPDDIDHINGIKTDNRLVNLRSVSNAENHKNMAMYKRNTSGVIGVYWHGEANKWHAQIRINGKRCNLGFYDDIDQAVAARKDAEVRHGYHANHGRNAST